MDKNLKAVLIIGGAVLGILAVAFVANAAGLTSSYGMPYRQQMFQGTNGYGMQGGMMGGQYGGMMGGGMMSGGMMSGGMMGGSGPMMDFDEMPCRNAIGTDGQLPSQNCPYYQQAQ
jgi:hypothetical protein